MRFFKRTRPATYAAALRMGLFRALRIGVGFGVGFFLMGMLIPTTIVYPEAPSAPNAVEAKDNHDKAVSQATRLSKAKGCVEAKGGVIPTHVIASIGGSAYRYMGDKGVGMAFEQLVFDGTIKPNEYTKPINHNMRVAIFCK